MVDDYCSRLKSKILLLLHSQNKLESVLKKNPTYKDRLMGGNEGNFLPQLANNKKQSGPSENHVPTLPLDGNHSGRSNRSRTASPRPGGPSNNINGNNNAPNSARQVSVNIGISGAKRAGRSSFDGIPVNNHHNPPNQHAMNNSQSAFIPHAPSSDGAHGGSDKKLLI